ncbi:hypothetical protein MRX96_054309 [Rhipicephalus microplus]
MGVRSVQRRGDKIGPSNNRPAAAASPRYDTRPPPIRNIDLVRLRPISDYALAERVPRRTSPHPWPAVYGLCHRATSQSAESTRPTPKPTGLFYCPLRARAATDVPSTQPIVHVPHRRSSLRRRLSVSADCSFIAVEASE